MRLSEAILLGSTMGDFDPTNWNCCLLGQGVRAVGAKHNFLNSEADVRWPWIHAEMRTPRLGSFCGAAKCSVRSIISALAFDMSLGKVTREQIVDWVRSVEPQEEVAPVVESVPEAVCA